MKLIDIYKKTTEIYMKSLEIHRKSIEIHKKSAEISRKLCIHRLSITELQTLWPAENRVIFKNALREPRDMADCLPCWLCVPALRGPQTRVGDALVSS